MTYDETHSATNNITKYSAIRYSAPNLEELDRAYGSLGEKNILPNSKNLKKYIKNKLEKETLEIWQKFWNEAEVGRWTHSLIPDIQAWKERGVGQLNFHLTQILTGHGVFNKFRRRIGKADSAGCWFGHDTEDLSVTNGTANVPSYQKTYGSTNPREA